MQTETQPAALGKPATLDLHREMFNAFRVADDRTTDLYREYVALREAHQTDALDIAYQAYQAASSEADRLYHAWADAVHAQFTK